jgi:hypothetical protein
MIDRDVTLSEAFKEGQTDAHWSARRDGGSQGTMRCTQAGCGARATTSNDGAILRPQQQLPSEKQLYPLL